MRGISKAWGRKSKRLVVLDEVDLTVEPGTTVWIGGRNGVGKTTLMRIAAGMISSEGGDVDLSGLDPSKDRRAYQRRIGLLAAGDRGLYPRLSVRRNLEFWARISFIPGTEREQAIETALRRFDLTDISDRWAMRLSLGQRQRLRLALTLLHHPDFVLLDEPRNSLDVEGNELLVSAVKDLVGRGGIAMWCSPAGENTDIDFDQAYELEHGKLRAV
jgi:ABC-2 type transport system ATP-binding protein